jgi:hypothetical protein
VPALRTAIPQTIGRIASLIEDTFTLHRCAALITNHATSVEGDERRVGSEGPRPGNDDSRRACPDRRQPRAGAHVAGIEPLHDFFTSLRVNTHRTRRPATASETIIAPWSSRPRLGRPRPTPPVSPRHGRRCRAYRFACRVSSFARHDRLWCGTVRNARCRAAHGNERGRINVDGSGEKPPRPGHPHSRSQGVSEHGGDR